MDLGGGLTLAVLSLEAVMNMVRSTDVWMSLICLLCSFTFFRISPDCPQGRDDVSWLKPRLLDV